MAAIDTPAHGLQYVYEEIERPLPMIIAAMERQGIRVDRGRLATLGERWADELADIRGRLPFNLGSTQQLGVALVDAGWKPTKFTDKTGAVATDKDTLEELRDRGGGDDQLLDTVLRYRQIQKLKSTYVDALLEASTRDGRVHCQFHQVGTETGRLSSSHPNLQNIPARTEDGRKIRACFVAGSGNVLIKADYGQIELRVAAAFSHDPQLTRYFLAGLDGHQAVADMLGVDRRTGKTLNFALLYGQWWRALMKKSQLGCSAKEAKDYYERYWAGLAGITQWKQGCAALAQARGYVETWYGRRNYVKLVPGMESWQRDKLLREAVNMPVQGTAADIVKLWMRQAAEALKPSGANILLQVHDELVVEVAEGRAEEVGLLLKGLGEGIVDLGVPLVVEVKYGENWDL